MHVPISRKRLIMVYIAEDGGGGGDNLITTGNKIATVRNFTYKTLNIHNN